jgi:hypothetical protein
MKRVTIGIFPAAEFSRYQRLFDALSELYSIQFEARDTGNFDGCGAALLFGANRKQAEQVAENGVRCMAFAEGDAVPVKSRTSNLVIASSSYVAQCFRGRRLADQSIDSVRPMKEESGDETVARQYAQCRRSGGRRFAFGSWYFVKELCPSPRQVEAAKTSEIICCGGLC